MMGKSVRQIWVNDISISLQKVRLLAFEEQFDLKVQEVDEKYKKKMEELMTQNTELKYEKPLAPNTYPWKN